MLVVEDVGERSPGSGWFHQQQRLPASATTVPQSIPQPAITLGVEFVEEQGVDVQPFSTERIG